MAVEQIRTPHTSFRLKPEATLDKFTGMSPETSGDYRVTDGVRFLMPGTG